EVNIPDMIGWDVDEVVKLIKKNKMKNVIIDYEFHDEIKRDIAFEQNKNGKMKRNDELKLKFSLGREEDLKPIDLKDLTDMEEFDATLWLKRNGIKFEIIREYNEDIKKGNVIRTDPKHGTNIKQSETTVKLYISKGKKIKAPDFTKMSLEEIEEWANKNNMKISYGSEYHTEIKIGNVIRANIKAGDSIDEETEIYIITSKGPLKMISYSDNDIDKIRSFASEYGLQLVVNEEFSNSVSKGSIISVDKKPGQTLSQSETITVVISRGKKKSIPNFVGMTIGNAKKTCSEYGFSCSFNYAYSNKTKDTVINQNKNAGSEVSEGTSVILTVSNGTRPSGGGSSNSSGGGNSNSGGGGNNTPAPTPTCDKSRGSALNIQAGSSGSQTQSIIRQLNPNHKFGWNLVNACPNGDSTPGTVCTTGLDGVWKNYCDSIYITVVR
ncbi:MAG: PASTA domain-containing protein, partial [Firmicutes bacterium]|nr:PASTA domain-containing protein [Bacillota bacterium]